MIKKLSALAGGYPASRKFAPNGWIDAKGKLCLTVKVDGARHGISIKTACMIDDDYDAFIAAATEALSAEFAATVRAEHAAKSAAPAPAPAVKATGSAGLSAQLAKRSDVTA